MVLPAPDASSTFALSRSLIRDIVITECAVAHVSWMETVSSISRPLPAGRMVRAIRGREPCIQVSYSSWRLGMQAALVN